MLPPEPGTWNVSASVTGTKFHIEHVADDEPENPQPYWHVQDLIVSEIAFSAARGLGESFGLDAFLPLRLVRDRVHYQDLARQPYAPPNPGLHHRNETLSGIADPQVGVTFGHISASWTLAARLGLSIPLGRTEANPFELGRLGKWHQHIQFGTGTWDPILGVAVGRAAGPVNLQLGGVARFPTSENEHGYRAGRRYALFLSGSPTLGNDWSANAGLNLAREEPEKWNGRIEGEGNLGRTDLFLSLGGGRSLPPFGALSVNVEVPLASKATGHQVDIPVIVSLRWSR
jgi:hypothetical protein